MTGLPLLPTLTVALVALASPADKLPTPQPERCLLFEADPEEGEMLAPEGLTYTQVQAALNGVIQQALYCERPEGRDAVHLTYDVTVGCDGVVSHIETVEEDDTPESYASCIAEVIAKADFDGHDLPDGMVFTYPLNVSW
jgi:hypothetical protein